MYPQPAMLLVFGTIYTSRKGLILHNYQVLESGKGYMSLGFHMAHLKSYRLLGGIPESYCFSMSTRWHVLINATCPAACAKPLITCITIKCNFHVIMHSN